MQMGINQHKMKYRNEQIPKIIQEMNGLASLYKEMSTLVIAQGTVMDRIDENVFEARY
jgi:t-SNARE complex subunit (syntaxin)